MFQGAASGGHWMVIAVLAVSTLLNAAYFLPIVHAAFLRAPPAGDEAARRGAVDHGRSRWSSPRR